MKAREGVICLLLLLYCGVGCNGVFRQGRTKKYGLVPPPAGVPEGVTLVQDEWFTTQRLDHFNNTDTRTWKQRYFSNSTFYKPGGPVFLMIGGEGPANPKWMYEGAWIHYARSLNAYLLSLEHRYYGKSHPTKDASTENLLYLSSEQALADLATFTVAMKDKLGLDDNKWVAFGGSYPGSLAAWYRLKYPHLVHAAVATSAPVLAQVNFKEYLEVVDDALATVSDECNSLVYEANRQLHILLQHRVGWQRITETYRLCTPLNGTDRLDVANLFSLLAGNIEDVVQYNKDNREFEGIKGTNITINTVCDIMANKTLGSPYVRYAVLNSMFLDAQEEKCLNHTYNATIQELQATSWENNSGVGGRAWMYQTCTEFGYYQSSDSSNQPFGNEFPLEFFTRQCREIFGPRFTPELIDNAVKRTNTVYGGRHPSVTRVVFPNGSIDPWHTLGVLHDISPNATALFINGTAHCANMYPASPRDPPQLVQARQQIFHLLRKWLHE
ncbi:hypothetical protein Pcinc_022357 [Petrolisthes cinctipes]|uniref:Serine protease K12H4.7 n=1 Tax=Petrolisthes cinctipes TaxID=88211 RepID=A0AAE1FG98_PETCI|nr:hypothetical protein Pcinc_022357 [Petrolisthes cinctipes]